MAGLLAFSVLIVPLLIGYSQAGARNPRRGLRRTVAIALAFNLTYVIALVFLYYRLLH
jgi:hypothetical protein